MILELELVETIAQSRRWQAHRRDIGRSTQPVACLCECKFERRCVEKPNGKPTQNRAQIGPESVQNRSPGRPGSARGPECRPRARNRRPQRRPERTQERPKSDPSAPRRRPRAPQESQEVAGEARKDAPRAPKSLRSRLRGLSASNFDRKAHPGPFSGRCSIDFAFENALQLERQLCAEVASKAASPTMPKVRFVS